VPRSLLQHAVEACATSGSEPAASAAEDLKSQISDRKSSRPEPVSTPISQAADNEREVIEI
jgi:hypothetical protein